jgi:DNA-binding CsgD family transcriptional regulator
MATAVDDQRLALVRLLHRELDLAGYFEAADRALQRCVPFDASCWLSLDPGGVMPTSHFSRAYSFAHLMQVAANEFLEDDVNKFADLVRAPRPVGILSQSTNGEQWRSPRYVRFLAPLGFADGDELRAVFKDGGAVWGAVAIHRRHGTFTDIDAKAIADVGGLLAQGIRRAILRSALSAIGDDQQPGLIVLRRDDSVESMTAAASRWLGELIDSTATLGTTPLTIVSVAQVARRAAAGHSDETATVRLPRRTGGWMRLDASLLDGGEQGQVAVIISAAHEPEVARLIAQFYGLSEREQDVTRLVLHGHSTVEMAESLHLSPYTVQDHLKAIFAKVGVRSRRELVAQLFLQQCAPRLSNGALPGPDGWFIDDRRSHRRFLQPTNIITTIAHTSKATARPQRAKRRPAN